VGLPQLCFERNLIRNYFQQQNATGFDYAYTFPGMNRVLQAIGRVIRSETDLHPIKKVRRHYSCKPVAHGWLCQFEDDAISPRTMAVS
jgi:hypothetical protein